MIIHVPVISVASAQALIPCGAGCRAAGLGGADLLQDLFTGVGDDHGGHVLGAFILSVFSDVLIGPVRGHYRHLLPAVSMKQPLSSPIPVADASVTGEADSDALFVSFVLSLL